MGVTNGTVKIIGYNIFIIINNQNRKIAQFCFRIVNLLEMTQNKLKIEYRSLYLICD